MSISHSDLLKMLNYNPEIGIWKWKVNRRQNLAGHIAGCISKKDGYRRIVINGKSYLSSRLAFFYMKERWPNPEADHKNKIRHDDRWDNLQESTRAGNVSNRDMPKPINWNMPVGVSPHGNKFRAVIMHNYKQIHLGLFTTKEEAHKEYLRAKNELKNS